MRRMEGALAALALAAVATSASAGPARERVVLAVDGVSETRNLPVLLAERLGYFRETGLTVTLVDSPADPSPSQLMADGRADGAVAFYHHTFVSQAVDHSPTEAVVALGATPGVKVLVAARLKDHVRTVADLKGRRIYAGGDDSGKTTALNWLMAESHLGPGDYLRLKNVAPERMARDLASGAADAVVLHEPDADRFAAQGVAFVLVDLESIEGVRAALGSIYPSTVLYLPRTYVNEHPATAQALVEACLKALDFIGDHGAEDIAKVLPRQMIGPDRAAFVRRLALDKQMFATDGRMPPQAARREWQVMSALTPAYAAIRFDETFDNRFVDAARRR